VCVLDTNIKGCTLGKGVLVQAKMAGCGGVTISPGNQRFPEICVAISKRDPTTPNSLFAQCESMLSITPVKELAPLHAGFLAVFFGGSSCKRSR
jgi:hypothetical protein